MSTHFDLRPDFASRELPTVPEGAEVSSLEALAERVLQDLESRGWADVRQPLTEPEFEEVARRLGTIELRTEIFIDAARTHRERESRDLHANRPTVYQDAELGLHSDRPTAEWLAWYCVRQDAESGATVLVDTRDLPERFSREDLDLLGRLEVAFSTRDPTGRELYHHHPLLERDDPHFKVYYLPWGVRLPAEDESWQRLLARFAHYVQEKKERFAVRVRLKERQALFIDNRRLLHGRGPLPPDSPRRLIRLLIQRQAPVRCP
jgi:hypothetical protein